VLHAVLVEPEIPQNTGNIARTCAATGTALHLVKPLGFSLEDRYLKRAGLDYWDLLQLYTYESLDEFFKQTAPGPYIFATKKGRKAYSDIQYPDGAYIVFGKETLGLPEKLLVDNIEMSVRIPMKDKARSLNLSNAAAILIYEALRQQNFPHLAQIDPEGILKTEENRNR
jgi:tRNA (cytidine/uridine-2'-O-)-methyltransferase